MVISVFLPTHPETATYNEPSTQCSNLVLRTEHRRLVHLSITLHLLLANYRSVSFIFGIFRFLFCSSELHIQISNLIILREQCLIARINQFLQIIILHKKHFLADFLSRYGVLFSMQINDTLFFYCADRHKLLRQPFCLSFKRINLLLLGTVY